MARATTSARRYAEAAFEIAQRDGTVERWLEQLQRVAAVLADENVLRRLEDPAVPLAVRADALGQGVGDDGPAGMRNLLELLLRRRRLERLPRIADEYRRLYNRRDGIVEATAVSAVPLSDEDIEQLRTRLAATYGSKVELRTRVDPALIGGIALRVGDRLIDGSIRGRLERLRNTLIASA